MPVDFQTTNMDKFVLTVQIFVLFLCLYKSTLAQGKSVEFWYTATLDGCMDNL